MQKFKKIYFEIGNTCNLQCSFCPEVAREKKRVSISQAKEVLEKISPFTERVCFHLMGEPLLHPEFPNLIRLARDLGVTLEITTNGTLLSDAHQSGSELGDALLSSAVAQINFSLQSFADNFPSSNPITYFEKILNFTDRARRERPDLYINFRLWNQPQNAKEDEENNLFLTFLENRFGISINRRIDPRLTKSKNLVDRVYLHYDTRFDWPNANGPDFGENGTCWGTRSQIGIHADGTVVPCCLDKEAAIPLGNIFQSDLSNITAGEKFQKIREGFEKGRRVENLCRHCQFATRFS